MGYEHQDEQLDDVINRVRPVLGPTRRTLQLKTIRAFSVLQTRLQFLLTDELICRLRIIFEREFLYKVGVHWGDNQICGAVYSAMHRRSLVESRLQEATKSLVLQGKLKNISIPDLFILVLQVSTNRFRRVDGQPACVTSLAGKKPPPPPKVFRLAGTVEPKDDHGDQSVSRQSALRRMLLRAAQSDDAPRIAGLSKSCEQYVKNTFPGKGTTTPPAPRPAATSRSGRADKRRARPARPPRRSGSPRRPT